MSLMLLYHLVGIHGLWYAPIYGWMLLVSAWARRAAFLWATLPLLAIGIVEKIAFSTFHFANMLGYRLSGGGEEHPGTKAVGMAAGISTLLMPDLSLRQFLMSPSLWLGLALTAAFLFAAIRLRRNREPI
jgi:ABC-2 type transport system permease protein